MLSCSDEGNRLNCLTKRSFGADFCLQTYFFCLVDIEGDVIAIDCVFVLMLMCLSFSGFVLVVFSIFARWKSKNNGACKQA